MPKIKLKASLYLVVVQTLPKSFATEPLSWMSVANSVLDS